MPIGLYETKYRARRWMSTLMPLCKNLSPTTLTLCLFPVGLLMALCHYLGFHFEWKSGLVLGIFFGILRMILGTLDGYVAEFYNKCTPKGELLNRLAPEVCDALYLVALALSSPCYWALFMLAISWLISFLGILPALVHKKPISIGPLGQTDRLVVLLLFSTANLFSSFSLLYFFKWCVIAGVVTSLLRTIKLFKLNYEQTSKTT